MRNRVKYLLPAAAGVAVLTACAGSAAVESWVQGTWECTAVSGEGDSTTATVEVGDGTWTATVDDAGFTTAGTYSGSWDLATGTLSVDAGSDRLEGTFLGVPERTDGLGALTGATWGNNDGTMSVHAAAESISIAYTDESAVTTTSCSKE